MAIRLSILAWRIPWTVACQAPLFMGILQARTLEWVDMPPSRGSSQPRNRTQVSCIAGRFFFFLPSEPPGKPRNTGVGCHSLLQGTFLTQRSNPGLLHYRQMLYCLSYQGSPTQLYAAAAAKSLQSCPTLCDPIDGKIGRAHV